MSSTNHRYPLGPKTSEAGFTLIEAVIASVLVCLLAFCAYRGVTTVRGSARAMADRVAAQGLCLAKLEKIRSIAYEEVNRGNPACATTNVVLNILPGFGEGNSLMATLSVDINSGAEGEIRSPAYKDVTVWCKWTFMGRERKESVSAYIVDGYNTYAEVVSHNGEEIDLTPSGKRPSTFLIEAANGVTYDATNLPELASMGSVEVSTIVFCPGDGNGKTSTYSRGSEPILMSIQENGAGGYRMLLSCENASYSSR